MVWTLKRGAEFLPDGTVRFSVWAPRVQTLTVQIVSLSGSTPMKRHSSGLYTVTVDGLAAGSRYYYCLDGERLRPDPVSRSQPAGVHGPSEITVGQEEMSCRSRCEEPPQTLLTSVPSVLLCIVVPRRCRE